MIQFKTATEAYNYIMAKVAAANEAGDLQTARVWSAKLTRKMINAARAEQQYKIATRADA